MPKFELKGIEVIEEQAAKKKKKRKRVWVELTPQVEAIIDECKKSLKENTLLKGNVNQHVTDGANKGLLTEFLKVRDALKPEAKKVKTDDKDETSGKDLKTDDENTEPDKSLKPDEKTGETGKDHLESDDKIANEPPPLDKSPGAQNDFVNKMRGAFKS